jgi:hypothetical protein
MRAMTNKTSEFSRTLVKRDSGSYQVYSRIRMDSNRKEVTMRRAMVCAVILSFMGGLVLAEDLTWTGNGGDNRWDNPANWDTGRVPGKNDNVTIPEETPECRISGYVDVQHFDNQGTIGAVPGSAFIGISAQGGFENHGTVSSHEARVNIETGTADLVNRGTIEGTRVHVETNTLENYDDASIRGFGTEGNVFIHAQGAALNGGTIAGGFPWTPQGDGGSVYIESGDDMIGIRNGGVIEGGVPGDDIGCNGGDVFLVGPYIENYSYGEIASGDGGFWGTDGNIGISTSNFINAGSVRAGRSHVPPPAKGVRQALLGKLFVSADSLVIASGDSIVLADSLQFRGRVIIVRDVNWGIVQADHAVEFLTTVDGVVDFSETHQEDAIYCNMGPNKIISDNIIAPAEGLGHIFFPAPEVHPANTTLVGGYVGRNHAFGPAGTTDSMTISLQNQSTTARVLNYSVHSFRGWVTPFSGSTTPLSPFDFAAFSAGYTIPEGTESGVVDTVRAILTIAPDFSDTSLSTITCRGEPEKCQIQVVSPNGGETWCSGDLEDIIWISSSTSGSICIVYSTDAGQTWDLVVSDTPDDGIHPWIIPDQPTKNCLVRICDCQDSLCCQMSHEPFSICPPPQAVFTADPETATGDSCQVHFTDQSTGCVTGWFWDFGDGESSSQQNPTHTYLCNGFYTVSLTVTGPCRGDMETKTEFITCTCPAGYTLGDVNCDGTITPGDALCAFWRAILDLFREECQCEDSEQAADVNCDGNITPGDALCIFWRSILGDWTEECQCEK